MPFVSLEESEILKQQTNNLSFQMIVSAYLSTLAFNREKVQLNITNNRPKNNNLILIHIYSNNNLHNMGLAVEKLCKWSA